MLNFSIVKELNINLFGTNKKKNPDVIARPLLRLEKGIIPNRKTGFEIYLTCRNYFGLDKYGDIFFTYFDTTANISENSETLYFNITNISNIHIKSLYLVVNNQKQNMIFPYNQQVINDCIEHGLYSYYELSEYEMLPNETFNIIIHYNVQDQKPVYVFSPLQATFSIYAIDEKGVYWEYPFFFPKDVLESSRVISTRKEIEMVKKDITGVYTIKRLQEMSKLPKKS